MKSAGIRLAACGVLALLGASSSACSSSDHQASEGVEAEADVAFDGVWHARFDGGSLDVNIEGDRAKIVRFGPGFQIGNPEIINGGDPLATELKRVDARTFSARVANIEFEHSPALAKDWPSAVSYVDALIAWDEGQSHWVVADPALEFSRGSANFDGKYAPAGACEQKFVNNQGATLFICDYPQDDSDCSSSGEKAFWPNDNCEHLGYLFQSDDIGNHWYESDSSNVTPGAHGQWGDRSGGGKIVSAAAAATGGASDPDPDPGGEPATVIASCSDEWVCTEIDEGADGAAFQAQCEKGGDTPSPYPCPAEYKGGPACTATFTSVGQSVHGTFYWKPDFCANNPGIDTAGTCDSLNGTQSGDQCQPP